MNATRKTTKKKKNGAEDTPSHEIKEQKIPFSYISVEALFWGVFYRVCTCVRIPIVRLPHRWAVSSEEDNAQAMGNRNISILFYFYVVCAGVCVCVWAFRSPKLGIVGCVRYILEIVFRSNTYYRHNFGSPNAFGRCPGGNFIIVIFGCRHLRKNCDAVNACQLTPACIRVYAFAFTCNALLSGGKT